MNIWKSSKFYDEKVRIDKKENKKTAFKIQIYSDKMVDEYINNYANHFPMKPVQSQIKTELAILNKPHIYKLYNRILNSKYVHYDFIDKIHIKNKSDKMLNYVVEEDLKRINKNLDAIEQVLNKYKFFIDDYNDMVKEQEKHSLINSNRYQILKQAVEKYNPNEPFVPPKGYTYRQVKWTSENLLRQAQMKAKMDEVQVLNEKYKKEGNPIQYVEKYWIHTHRGKTTRHASNHLQHVPIEQPFLVVNDSTLDIDEMMYPSDPMGSYANSYICYCEMEFRSADGHVFNSIFDNDKKYNIKWGRTLETSNENDMENKPLTKDMIDEDIQDLFIDTNDLTYDERSDDYYFDYKSEEFQHQIEWHKDGSFDYKSINFPLSYQSGVEAHHIQSGRAYITPSLIERHNRNLLNKPLYYKNKLGLSDGYIGNSDTVKRVVDNDGIAWAVDEKGTKYRIDQLYKDDLFRKQSDLQDNKMFRKFKAGMTDYASSSYKDINQFMYANKQVNRQHLKPEKVPNVMPSEDYNKLQSKFDELGDAYKNNDEKLVKKVRRDINKIRKDAEYDNSLQEILAEKLVKNCTQIIGGINSSPGLQENTMLKRKGYWNPDWNKVGKVVDYGDGFVSTSFTEKWKTNYSKSKNAYEITILAPKETKGVAMTDYFNAYTEERELLLGRHQKWEVVEYNNTDFTVTVRVVE